MAPVDWARPPSTGTLGEFGGLSASFHELHLFQTDGSAGTGLTMPTIGMSPRLPEAVLADYPVGETLGSSGKP